MEILARCAMCGQLYTKRNGKAKYCSPECKRAGRSQTLRKWREKHPEYMQGWLNDHPGYMQSWREQREA